MANPNDGNAAVRIPMMSKQYSEDRVVKELSTRCGPIMTYFMRGASFVMIFEKPESAALAVALTGKDIFGIGSNLVIEYTDARDRGASMSMDKKAQVAAQRKSTAASSPPPTSDEYAATLVFKNLPREMRPAEFAERVLKIMSQELSVDVPTSRITMTRSRHAQGVYRGIAFVNFGDVNVAKHVLSFAKDKAIPENDELWQHIKIEFARSTAGDADESQLASSMKTLAKSAAIVTSVHIRELCLVIAAQYGFQVDFETDTIPTKVKISKPTESSHKLSADAPVFIPGQPIAEKPISASAPTFSMYVFPQSQPPRVSPSPSPGSSYKPRGLAAGSILPIRQPRQPPNSDNAGFCGAGRGSADLLATSPPVAMSTSPGHGSASSAPRHRSHSRKH